MRIPSGVTDQYVYFVGVDATDLKTRETGLSSFTVYRSRNGAAAVAMTTPTVNETDSTNMPGVYGLLLDEDMTIGSGNDSEEMVFHITASGMAPVTRTIELYRPKITAGNTLGVESDGDLTKVNTLDGHTAQTGDTFAQLPANFSSLGIESDGDLTQVNNCVANTDMRGTDSAFTAANGTTLLNRIGSFTGSGVNTVLGFFQALMRSDSTTPSDLGGSYDDATDSLQAIRDRGDSAWPTATGFSTHSAADVRTEMDSNSTQFADIKAKTEQLPSGIKKNTAYTSFQFLMVDSSGDPATGLTITAQRSIDGAAFASCTNSASELSNGMYNIDLSAADLNGDTITLRFTATGAQDRLITIITNT